MDDKKIKFPLGLLSLFILSILVWSTKYYLMFFSTWDKNISQNLTKIEQSLQGDTWTLEGITYRQLLTTQSKVNLSDSRLGQVNIKDWYLKVWSEKYYFTEFNKNYPWIIDFFTYGDRVDLEYIPYKEKNYVTFVSPHKELWVRVPKEYLLLWEDKILTTQKVLDSWTEYKVIYTKETEFREKWTLKKLEETSETINQFNSSKTQYKIVRLEGVLVWDVIYVEKVIYWIIYDDEKKVLDWLINDYKKISLDLDTQLKAAKEFSKKSEYDNLRSQFKWIWIEYNSDRSIYANLETLTTVYKTKETDILNKYTDLFRKGN